MPLFMDRRPRWTLAYKVLEAINTFKIAGVAVTSTAAELNKVDGFTGDVADLNLLDGTVAGTSVASKVLSLGANKNTDVLAVADGGLKLGSGAGTAVTATAAELNEAADLTINGSLLRIKKLPITATPTGSEQDTGWDLPAKAIVLDVWVDVTTVEAVGTAKTFDVGTKVGESGGDPDGFLDGVSVAAAGVQRGVPSIVEGGTETYYADTTRGLLLRAAFKAGANVAGDTGIYAEKAYLTGSLTAKSVVYTAGDVNWTAFRGAIYIMYVELG